LRDEIRSAGGSNCIALRIGRLLRLHAGSEA
jgi:hypothetical protein